MCWVLVSSFAPRQLKPTTTLQTNRITAEAEKVVVMEEKLLLARRLAHADLEMSLSDK